MRGIRSAFGMLLLKHIAPPQPQLVAIEFNFPDTRNDSQLCPSWETGEDGACNFDT